MTSEEIAAKEAVTAAADAEAKPKAEAEEKAKAAPSQDPIKAELDKVKRKPKSEAEQAAYVLKSTADRLRSLGGDPAQVLGIETAPFSDDDNAPVTVAMLKQRDREQATKTAELLADEQVSDLDERELVKYHLSNTIKSTGNPTEDLRIARSIVNSVKNTQLVEENARKGTPKSHSSGSGAPPRAGEEIFEPTPAEAQLMRAPFNLSKEKVIAARKKEQK